MPDLHKAELHKADLHQAIDEELKYQMRRAEAPESLWNGIERARRARGAAVRPRRTIAMGIALVPCAAAMLMVLFSGAPPSNRVAPDREWVRANPNGPSVTAPILAFNDARANCALCHIQ